MRFARKLTLRPHKLTADDVDALREHFDEQEVIELVYTVSFYNSVTRWTDALGLPQDRHFGGKRLRFDAPTPEPYRDRTTQVIPAVMPPRPPLESRAEVEAALQRCRQRKPCVALPTEAEARRALPERDGEEPIPQWIRALACFPETARRQVEARRAMETTGRLAVRLKARLAWICARENRAWYALGRARKRLRDLGMDDDSVFVLEGPSNRHSPAERTAFAFARKLTAAPRSITDGDVAGLREHFSDRQTAEIVYVICTANMFDRLTEGLRLRLEEGARE